jgi:hypothetical protein
VKEHSEEPREAVSQGDAAVAASPGGLVGEVLRLQHAAGNRAVARLMIQRRTDTPERSDKTQTFTYSLKLYTVDEESFAQAQDLAERLNAFSGNAFDFQTQRNYTVLFKVGVFAPPEPDILERAFHVDLHYKTGRRRLRRKKYREAAERWWLWYLREEGNTGNLFLGDQAPSEATKDYIRERAGATGSAEEQAISAEFKRRLDAAQGSEGAREDARDYYRKEMHKLRKNDPEKTARRALDAPKEGQRGVTLAHSVVRMRGTSGTPEYKTSIRLHEIMHLFGLVFDYEEVHESVMSYPYLQANQDEVVMPKPMDLEQLVDPDNPPSTKSVD